LPGDDDVIRRARIREVSHSGVFSGSAWSGAGRLYKATVQRRVEIRVSQREKQFSEESESARSGACRLYKATVQRRVLVRASKSSGVSVEES
jgi:hypothetical protein